MPSILTVFSSGIIVKYKTKKYVLLASTDTELDARLITNVLSIAFSDGSPLR